MKKIIIYYYVTIIIYDSVTILISEYDNHMSTGCLVCISPGASNTLQVLDSSRAEGCEGGSPLVNLPHTPETRRRREVQFFAKVAYSVDKC